MSEFFRSLHQALQKEIFAIAGTSINLLTLLTFLIIVAATILASRVAQKGVGLFLERRGVRHPGTVGVSTRLTHYTVMITGLAVGFNTLGINLAALFTAGAVLAIAVGFAMQTIAQNFVSGIILLSEQSIKPGDVLEVDGVMVQVVHLGMRATVARTLDDEDLIIPNSNLVQSTVKNYTLKDSYYRIRTAVGVSYGSDLKLVEDTLARTAEGIENRSPLKKPTVFLSAFGNSSVDFEVSIWVETPWQARGARSDLNKALWWALKEAGITIAFPQLDVHFDARSPGSAPTTSST